MFSETLTGTEVGNAAEDEVAARGVLHPGRLRHLRPYVDDRGDGFDSGGGADTRDVVDAVLQADHERARRKVRGERPRGIFGVGRLHAKKNDFRVRRRAHVGRRADTEVAGEMNALESESLRSERLHLMLPADERDRGPGEGEHAAEIAPDGAGTDDRDQWPIVVHHVRDASRGTSERGATHPPRRRRRGLLFACR